MFLLKAFYDSTGVSSYLRNRLKLSRQNQYDAMSFIVSTL